MPENTSDDVKKKPQTMGIEYHECSSCERSVYEEYIMTVTVEGYGSERYCDDCRRELFTEEPSEFIIVPKDAFTFETVPPEKRTEEKRTEEKRTEEKRTFSTLAELKDALGDDNPNKVVVRIRGDLEQESFTEMYELEQRCQRLFWLTEEHHHEDNTMFIPNARWWEDEERKVEMELESLKKKRKFFQSRKK
jgi:hypothetical protein